MSRGKTNPFPTFQFALLGLLLPGATYGYELHKQLSNQTGIGLIWQVKLSNVYAVLEQLLEKGWLNATLLPGESRPGRKMFQITEQGKAAFAEWLDSPVTHPREFRQDFMVKLFFQQIQNPAGVPAFLRSQLIHCRVWLKELRKPNAKMDSESGYYQSVISFRKSQIKSMVDWLEKELGSIENNITVSEVRSEEN